MILLAIGMDFTSVTVGDITTLVAILGTGWKLVSQVKAMLEDNKEIKLLIGKNRIEMEEIKTMVKHYEKTVKDIDNRVASLEKSDIKQNNTLKQLMEKIVSTY